MAEKTVQINCEDSVGRCGLRSVESWPGRGPPIRPPRHEPKLGCPSDNVLIEVSPLKLVTTSFHLGIMASNHVHEVENLNHGAQPQACTRRHNKLVDIAGRTQPADLTNYHLALTMTDPGPDAFTRVVIAIDNGGDRDQYLPGGDFEMVTPMKPMATETRFPASRTGIRFELKFVLDLTAAPRLARPLRPVKRIQLNEPIPASSEWMDSVMIRIWQEDQQRLVSYHFRVLDLDENSVPDDPTGYYQPALYDVTGYRFAPDAEEEQAVRKINFTIKLRRLSAYLPLLGEGEPVPNVNVQEEQLRARNQHGNPQTSSTPAQNKDVLSDPAGILGGEAELQDQDIAAHEHTSLSPRLQDPPLEFSPRPDPEFSFFEDVMSEMARARLHDEIPPLDLDSSIFNPVPAHSVSEDVVGAMDLSQGMEPEMDMDSFILNPVPAHSVFEDAVDAMGTGSQSGHRS